MSEDTTKLLNACVEYRAMVDKLEAENAVLRETLDSAMVLLRRWNRNDVTDDVVIDTRKAIHAARKELKP